MASQIVLEWDPSDPQVTGYRAYVGQASRSYDTVIDVSGTSVPLTNLDAGTTYFLAVTAIANGIESAFSDELVYTPRVDGTHETALPCRFEVLPECVNVSFWVSAGQRFWILTSTDLRVWSQVHSGTFATKTFFNFAESAQSDTPKFYRVIGTLRYVTADY